MTILKIDEVSRYTGDEIHDEYGRVLGTVISIQSSVDGRVESLTIKVADRYLETIEGERLKVQEGKIIVTPNWKFEASRIIENLDRAYKRRKALDTVSGQNELPSSVVEPMKRRLEEDIKALRIKADEVKKIINGRVGEIEDEELKVAKAIASIEISYFSGEVGEKGYTQSMNHLRKLKESISEEKRNAKEYLEKLDKTIQLAFNENKEVVKAKEEENKIPQIPQSNQGSLVVKIQG
ncbi:MAG: CdvA-like protein [Caldisphaera sp.]|uniref:CdvA-like protein n=1 Tax=Caldisphaera sp. TaxID=2060322 RepID=UPI00397E2E94